MTAARISYQDIPKEERKRLEAVIFRRPKPHAIFSVFFVFVMFGSRCVANALVLKGRPFWLHLTVDFVVAGCLSALIALLLFRPLLKREVEKAKNV